MQFEAKTISTDIIEDSAGENRRLMLADKAGICLSLGCVAHCLTLPALVSVLPALGFGFVLQGGFEIALGAAAILLGWFCVRRGWKQHRRALLWIPFGMAAALILGGLLLGHGGVEVAMVVAGGACLIATHLLNRWFCRARPVCSCVVHDESESVRKAA